jgi:hypothetical protein
MQTAGTSERPSLQPSPQAYCIIMPYYRCPHCNTVASSKSNLMRHFTNHGHAGCSWTDPTLCLISTTSHAQDCASVFTCGLFTGMQDVQPPSEAGPLSPWSTGLFPNTATAHPSPLCPTPDHANNAFLPGSPLIPSEVFIVPTGVGIACSSQFLIPAAALPAASIQDTITDLQDDHQSYDSYNNLLFEECLPIEWNPNYPSAFNAYILQPEDSKGSADDTSSDTTTHQLEQNALTNEWLVPNEAPTIDSSVQLHPVEESLLALIQDGRLPQKSFATIMEWAKFACQQQYNFSSAPVYRTAMNKMLKKYARVCGGPPQVEK